MRSNLRRNGTRAVEAATNAADPADAAGWLALAPNRHTGARAAEQPRHDRCPVTAEGARPAPAAPRRTGDVAHAAAMFVRQHHAEQELGDPAARLAEVDAELAATGTYTHTPQELAFGARVAWRNANRCIGRLYWQSLRVRDLRHLTTAEEIAEACADHLREAAPGGRIRPLITVFAPDRPDRPGPRIWNEQLIRYAGYIQRDGHVDGDPRGTGLTAYARRLTQTHRIRSAHS